MNDFLINTSVPVTLYSNMLNFRDVIKSFKSDGDLLKTMTIVILMKTILIHSMEK